MNMNKPTFLDDVEYKACSAAQSGKEWNWLNPQRAAFSHPANYYESSLQAWHEFEPLNADIECDVVVIGGGLLGVSAALHLSEQGVDTVLVEKNRVGSAASGRMVATDGWANVTDVKATDLAKRFADAGVSSIVYTDIARDGMMQGVNVEQTVQLAQYSGLPVIASGGVTNLDDVRNLKGQPGILGAITGRAIYEGSLNLREAQLLLDEQSL
jgi:hypothetical protein